jgi:hypothetical protein
LKLLNNSFFVLAFLPEAAGMWLKAASAEAFPENQNNK